MSTRIQSGAFMGALVVIGVVMSFVLGTDGTPPLWVPLAQLVAGIAVHFLVEAVGYRPEPLDPAMSDQEATSAGRIRWTSSMTLRMALIEAIAIVSLVGAFVLDRGIWTYAGGALVSLALMAVHVWPGSRPVTKTADALDADGKPSFLREAFGLPTPGPYQQF